MKTSITPRTAAAATVVAMTAVVLATAPGAALAQVPAACGDQPRLECKKSEKSGFSERTRPKDTQARTS